MTEPQVHIVTDGRLPDDIGEDDLVVCTFTASNARMWLDAGEPLQAFLALESVLGLSALAAAQRHGFRPIEFKPSKRPDQHEDARHLIANIGRLFDVLDKGEIELNADLFGAAGVLHSLFKARKAIEASSDPGSLADAVARSLLAGYGAAKLNVPAHAMEAPTLPASQGGKARQGQRREWFWEGARLAERLAGEHLSWRRSQVARAVLNRLEGKNAYRDLPKTARKVAERLGTLALEGKLVWPEGSAAGVRRRPKPPEPAQG